MGKTIHGFILLVCGALCLTACSGGSGSGSTPPPPPPAPTLSSIALSPLTVALSPGSTAALVVTGSYSDGSTRTLAASGETFATSNAAVATVSAAGVVALATGAANGARTTISATDAASGISTSAAASTVVTANIPASLTSIALSPLAVALTPGGMASLVVTGTYSDGSTRALAASSEMFSSSNTGVANVNAAGVVSVAAGAAAGTMATISATDTASGLTTPAADSTVVTVATMTSGPPTPGSVAAAAATAQNNAQCTAIQPFYWELGNADGALASGSSNQPGDTPVTADAKFPIASASKWVYGMYVVQQRGAAANLTAADIQFLTFSSGYTFMGSVSQSVTCTAPASGANSINHCLTLPSTTAGKLFSSQDPGTVGVFDYDSGHEENHAGQFQPEIADLDASTLGSAMAGGLGVAGVSLRFNQPLLAGGIYASANDYTALLRAVLSGQLHMREALGSHPVCAWVGAGCNAASSPQFTEHWHYSIGHWVEDDPTRGDGAFSSPGAFGFDPWIDADKQYYGVISRHAASGTGNQNGFSSALCGRQLRAAWKTGVQQ